MGKFNLKDDFEEIRIRAEEFYKNIDSIYCPYFKEKITFNAKGIRHLKFKSDQQARTRQDQYARLKLIHLAPQILKLSHTVQGIWYAKRSESEKTNNRWEKRIKEISFYEFIAVIENIRVKVIVKQIQGGEKHFWSIIPFWKIDKENSRRILHSGNPEFD